MGRDKNEKRKGLSLRRSLGHGGFESKFPKLSGGFESMSNIIQWNEYTEKYLLREMKEVRERIGIYGYVRSWDDGGWETLVATLQRNPGFPASVRKEQLLERIVDYILPTYRFDPKSRERPTNNLDAAQRMKMVRDANISITNKMRQEEIENWVVVEVGIFSIEFKRMDDLAKAFDSTGELRQKFIINWRRKPFV